MKPFKKNNADEIDVLKIADTNFRKFSTGMDANMDWLTIEPFVQKAIDFVIIPNLGQPLYDTLVADLETNSFELRYLQCAISEYTIALAIPSLRLTLGNGGVAENTPNNSAPAPQWATRDAANKAMLNGDKYLDLLMRAAETNDNQMFLDYRETDLFKDKTTLFFKTTTDLDKHLNILNSRRTFESLLRYLKMAEENLFDAVCGSWISELDTDEPKNKEVLKLAKRYVANQGLVYAIPNLKLLIEADGIKAVSNTDGFEDKRSLTNNSQVEAMKGLRVAAENTAAKSIKDLVQFLKTNKDDFQTWSNSPCAGNKVIREKRVVGGATGAILLT